MSNAWTWKGPVADGPDFTNNLLAVLRHGIPRRDTLFEFYHNDELYQRVAPGCASQEEYMAKAFAGLGYDYALVWAPFKFPRKEHHKDQSISLNELTVFTDRAGFEATVFPDTRTCDISCLDRAAAALAPGQVLMPATPGGLLENVIAMLGFDQLCMLLADDPDLVQDIFDRVGNTLLGYYQRVVQHPAVGFIMVNDDWGFKTQTMLSHKQMRKYVFPWHERFVATAHAVGKPAVLHSCGNLIPVMDDIIDGMHYDGKHSYEDTIIPVEEAYARWGTRIAILGGLDVDYLCRTQPEAIHARAQAMVERSRGKGHYALGTGNSVPTYIPQDHFLALLEAGVAGRPRRALAAGQG